MQCFLIILFVLTSSQGIEDAVYGKEECRKIKCPPAVDPICARISMADYIASRRLEMDWDILDEDVPSIQNIYMTMINECELEIMKCNQDLKADVVPMRYCEKFLGPSGSKSKRSKREATQESEENSEENDKQLRKHSKNKSKKPEINEGQSSKQKTNYSIYIKHPKLASHKVYVGVHTTKVFKSKLLHKNSKLKGVQKKSRLAAKGKQAHPTKLKESGDSSDTGEVQGYKAKKSIINKRPFLKGKMFKKHKGEKRGRDSKTLKKEQDEGMSEEDSRESNFTKGKKGEEERGRPPTTGRPPRRRPPRQETVNPDSRERYYMKGNGPKKPKPTLPSKEKKTPAPSNIDIDLAASVHVEPNEEKRGDDETLSLLKNPLLKHTILNAGKHSDIKNEDVDKKANAAEVATTVGAEEDGYYDDKEDVSATGGDEIPVNNEAVKKNSSNEVKELSTEVNMEEYYAECPKVCPARDVMVCARCQHGVYRTFSSVCHMRMFACLYRDDELELISRTPCVMSSPFFTKDLNMEPQGRISEPNDHDFILQYIVCRDTKDEDDPRCKEIRQKERKKIKHVINVDNLKYSKEVY